MRTAVEETMAGKTPAQASPLSAQQYRDACAELIEIWSSQPELIMARARDDMLARVLYGLALQVVSTTRSVVVLCDLRRYRDTYPLVRKCLEFAVMAQWLREHGTEGLQAF